MSNQPVKNNLQLIKERIQDICANLNRNPEEIKIIAVTKYVSIDRAKEALEAGIVHLGENRDEGLLEKWEEIGEDATWHFIGSLQSKKVKNVINHVGYIHSCIGYHLQKSYINAQKTPSNALCRSMLQKKHLSMDLPRKKL